MTEKDIFNENFNIKNMSYEELRQTYELLMAKADVIKHHLTVRTKSSRKHSKNFGETE